MTCMRELLGLLVKKDIITLTEFELLSKIEKN